MAQSAATKRQTHRVFGRLRKLPSGRYQASYLAPDGKVYPASETFQTKALADVWLAEQQTRISKGDWDTRIRQQEEAAKTGKGLTLGQMAEEWRNHRQNRDGNYLSPTTRYNYERMMATSLAPFANKPIRSITSDQIQAWLTPLKQRTPNMATKSYSHLSTLMRYAVKRKWVDVNPCDIDFAATYSAEKPIIPTIDQVEQMIANAKPEWKALIALAAWSGLRKGELLALTRDDLIVHDFDGRTAIQVSVGKSVVIVSGEAIVKAPKTKSSIRTVFLDPRANETVLNHLAIIPKPGSTLLFPAKGNTDTQISIGGFNRIWYPIRKSANFDGRFHSFRGFALTQFGLTGATAEEIRARGGHTDIRVAARYQHTTGREWELLNRSTQ
jgi:integrase